MRDDEAAREARAKSLHNLIDEIKDPQIKSEGAKDTSSCPQPLSYREQIQKRMRELDKDERT